VIAAQGSPYTASVMEASTVRLLRGAKRLESDDRRVITRYLDFRSPRRIRSILNRIMGLADEQVERQLSELMQNFAGRTVISARP
jgi:hypothetical protein